MVQSSLTILFESPYWIGLFEIHDEGGYRVAKVTFGAEPKDYEVLDFILNHWDRLTFSPPIATGNKPTKRPNPKRMQRQIGSELEDKGMGTKAQQALKLQHEENKLKRKTRSKELKALKEQQKFAIRQAKKKAKHKGR